MTKKLKIDTSKQDTSKARVGTDDTPDAGVKQGERVEVSYGEIPNDECSTTEASARGVSGYVDGAPYVAPEGPNKGKVIQPVRTDDGGILGVPRDRLSRPERRGSKSRSHFSFGWRPGQYEQIFGKKS